uniref:Aminoglycoside phosphotransferase domain-containing protein n=1 Tax=Kalanchoe fedtschenkoi TaxID=63787 RepID=A0A7N0U8S9_KALFE
MALRTSELLQPVQPAMRLDLDSLFRYCCDHVRAFPVSARSTLAVYQFGHGQSNPTYLIEVRDEGSVKRYVLRKKPAGKLLQSAHAVEREFQVLQALGLHTQVPVPKVYCLCTDSSVIGTPFYIMEYLDGRIYMDPKLPGVSPASRNAIYRSVAKLLAALHSADVDAIGLGEFGQRDNYCKRQVERWAKQYQAATGEGKPEKNPKVFELINWLRRSVPAEDSSGAAGGIVHGDFRIDNLVFHPVEDHVIGILDWELSTLGNQMCDVAYSCLPYIVDATRNNSDAHEGFEKAGLPAGIPSQADYLAEYCSAAGKPWPAAEWKFYLALSLFRLVSICTGIHSRWIMGNASGGERAQWAGKMAHILVDAARAVVLRESIVPERPPLVELANKQPEKVKVGTEDCFDGTGRFIHNKKVRELRSRVLKFMEAHIYPREKDFNKLAFSDSRWTVHPDEEKLQDMARREGLWNLFVPFDSAARARKILFDGKKLAPSDNLLGGWPLEP